jgi:hypothetical protein
MPFAHDINLNGGGKVAETTHLLLGAWMIYISLPAAEHAHHH